MDGYPVASSVAWDDFTDRRSIDGTIYGGEDDFRVKFHWYSVNQPIDPQIFDGSILRSLDKMRALLEEKPDSDKKAKDTKTIGDESENPTRSKLDK